MRRGLVAAALGVAGLGAAVGRPLAVALAAIPLAVLAAGSLTAPSPPRVAVDRELSTVAPALGERVTVRVIVENRGRTVADCLVRDSLPDGIDAVDDPASIVRLPAGEAITATYTMIARRGTHEFGPVEVTARGIVDEVTVECNVETSFRCRADSQPLRLRESVGRQVGDPRATAGSGVEFHSVREYRPSDARRRIDWRRYARSRELTTVEFRAERTARVHLLVDARSVCDVRRRSVEPSALAFCADATERLALALVERGVEVGVGFYPDALGALPPASGHPQRTRIERLLQHHEALPWGESGAVDGTAQASGWDDRPRTDAGSGSPNSRSGGLETGEESRGTTGRTSDVALPEPIRRDARVLLVSPCLDDPPVTFAVSVADAGGDVGVLSPSVGGETPGAIVERARRARRVAQLEGAGVPMTDWQVETPLSAAVEEVFETWT